MVTPSPAPSLADALGDPAQRPGTRTFVEARFGPQATFGQRALAQVIDGMVALPIVLVPLVAGTVCLVEGIPDRVGLIVAGIALLVLGVVAGLAFEIWNQAVRIARTGKSLGRRAVGLTVVHAETGELLTTGQALLKALVSGAAGLISAIWMLLDDDGRTLSDRVAHAAVVRRG